MLIKHISQEICVLIVASIHVLHYSYDIHTFYSARGRFCLRKTK